MRILLYNDETLDIDISTIAENLSRICSCISFTRGNEAFLVPGSMVSASSTYDNLSPHLREEANTAHLSILFTRKPYDNNYFYEYTNTRCIVSLFGWDELTALPLNNGAVYFIASLLAGELDFGVSHEENTGCINDFWWDKRGVDVGMRAAFICPECQTAFRKRKPSQENQELYDCLTLILNNVSQASRNNQDIVVFWKLKPTQTSFDVFLCHNSEDKVAVRKVCQELKSYEIRPWFDEEQLRPGLAWQDSLETLIPQIKTVAVLVGPNGVGPWQNVEIRAFLQEFVRRGCPVIPVILPGTKQVPELPIFLRQMTCVDMRKTGQAPIKLLLWGITGKRRP